MRKVGKVREGWKVGKRKKGKRWEKVGRGKMGSWNMAGGKVKKQEKGHNEGKGWTRREDDLGEGN
jgi:hypothetical protein